VKEEELRAVGARLIAGALREIDPARSVAETLADLPELVEWVQGVGRQGVGAPERPGAIDAGGRTVLVAVGKAAPRMARGAVAVLGEQLEGGVVVAPHGTPAEELPGSVEVMRAGHPLPDEGSLAAGHRIRDLLSDLGATDRVLVLLSGGGSALVALPCSGLTLEDLRQATGLLLASGLPIEEVNAVRRVLDDLKGGGMAAMAQPARILALVLSDIPSSDPSGGLSDVASGPLSSSPVSHRDVEILLRRAELFDQMPDAVQGYLIARREGARHLVPERHDPNVHDPNSGREEPAEVRLHPVGGGEAALEGMRRAATQAGFQVQILHHDLRGPADRVGRGLARAGLAVLDGAAGMRLPACLLAAGESTVRVTGNGSGGPNQEVALSAALAIQGRERILVGSFGTDGIDGPTEAAGGWVDGRSVDRARAEGHDLEEALRRNDSGTVLASLGDRILTGPTGTNVADVMFVLVGDPGSGQPGS